MHAIEFGIPFEADVVSAHRMPTEMIGYGQTAHGRGLRVIIAGAGGAAHLPGMLASGTDALAARLTADLLDFARELNDTATRKGVALRHKVGEVFAEGNALTRGSR